MPSIAHFYFIPDKQTTNEDVNKIFIQEFMHVHFDIGTMLIRKMKYEGEKLDLDGDIMCGFLHDVDQQPELKQAIADFLNDV